MLAQRLISLGFGPKARIGVFVNRTADLVIAPLAILKSGTPMSRSTPLIQTDD